MRQQMQPSLHLQDDEAAMKRTANNIIASLEPEKMFKCAGYVDSLKNDLRKMLRNKWVPHGLWTVYGCM